jgi:hypothetical protein
MHSNMTKGSILSLDATPTIIKETSILRGGFLDQFEKAAKSGFSLGCSGLLDMTLEPI